MNIQQIVTFFSPYSSSDDKNFLYKILFFILYTVVIFFGTGTFGDFIFDALDTSDVITFYRWTGFFIVGIFAIQRIRYLKISYWWLIPILISDIFIWCVYLICLGFIGNSYLKDYYKYVLLKTNIAPTLIQKPNFEEYRKILREQDIKNTSMNENNYSFVVNDTELVKQPIKNEVQIASGGKLSNRRSKVPYIIGLIFLIISIIPVGFICIASLSGVAGTHDTIEIVSIIMYIYIFLFIFLIGSLFS